MWNWATVLILSCIRLGNPTDDVNETPPAPTHSFLRAPIRHHEILRREDVLDESSQSRVRRDILSTPSRQADPVTTELRFKALGREFHLYVHPQRDIFAPGFKAEVVGSSGRPREVVVGSDVVYAGHVEGEHRSTVDLVWETDWALNAKIVTDEETYFIEPASRLLQTPDADRSMIIYRASDVTADEGSSDLCGDVRHLRPAVVVNATQHSVGGQQSQSVSHPPMNEWHYQHSDGGRNKRSSVVKNTCPLLLVADYKFFSTVGLSNEHTTTNYMLALISKVNTIYTSTTWVYDEGDAGTLKHMGFQVKKILIRAESCSTTTSCDSVDYNCLADDCGPSHLLDSFAATGAAEGAEPFSEYCLAHLFTAYRFKDKPVLGLAYLAAPHTTQGNGLNAYGGICSPTQFRQDDSGHTRGYAVNSGWSNAVDSGGHRVVTQRAEILLAHELGHNWGSEHDPADCSPGSAVGNYIMHHYSVSGTKSNNKIFSVCSRRSIGRVLQTKSDWCFKERVITNQGNYEVNKDEGEECDVGPAGDKCCTSEFKLRDNAECSDHNSACCLGCKIARARNPPAENGTRCQDELLNRCLKASYCNGRSSDCPVEVAGNGTRCLPEGRCYRGAQGGMECLPLCHVIGLTPCLCSDMTNSCSLCCEINGECQALTQTFYDQRVSNSTNMDSSGEVRNSHAGYKSFIALEFDEKGMVSLPDFASCSGGQCVQGQCVPMETGLIERLWSFFSELTPSGFVTFMKDNLVGTSIIFSIILWMPFSVWIYCKDKQLARQLEADDEMTAPFLQSHFIDLLASQQPVGNGESRNGDSRHMDTRL